MTHIPETLGYPFGLLEKLQALQRKTEDIQVQKHHRVGDACGI